MKQPHDANEKDLGCEMGEPVTRPEVAGRYRLVRARPRPIGITAGKAAGQADVI
jgi:hypothetical protein